MLKYQAPAAAPPAAAPAPLDRLFHALADPGRRAMVDRLGQGAASVTELAKPLAMSLPAVVQHLKVLEESGLIRSEKTGRVRTCRLEPAALRTVEDWVAARRASWEHHLDRLGDFLAGLDTAKRAKKGGKP
jgi:DNA-binding transcriptional ArsR family regulator